MTFEPLDQPKKSQKLVIYNLDNFDVNNIFLIKMQNCEPMIAQVGEG